jgi:hypothetical protein
LPRTSLLWFSFAPMSVTIRRPHLAIFQVNAPILSINARVGSPERAYDVDFFESFATEVGWRIR